MKTLLSQRLRNATLTLLALGLAGTLTAADAPKKLLVVTTTMEFHHSSIETAEKVLEELGRSSGVFSVEFARVNPRADEFKGADGKPDRAKITEAITRELAEKLSPAALKKYDGFIFANTTGILPLPDKDAFLAEIRSGKAFIGMHSASDTFHGKGMIDPYIDMCGGEFQGHGAQVGVEAINKDPNHAANKHLGPTWKIAKEEIYLFKNYDAQKLRELLVLDRHPNKPEEQGNFGVSWCKLYGQGRVFYTSLGHREDIWDVNTPANFKRENGAETSKAYQEHILGGIKWALRLAPGEATPHAK